MYDLVDHPLTSLAQRERLLVWAMRSWVGAMTQRHCPGHVIAPVFARSALLCGLQPFLRMMALFNRHGLENFQFCSLACGHVSEHEALILNLLRNLRSGAAATVRDTLALLVDEEAIGCTLSMLVALGRAVEDAAA